jgi:acyl-CoA dehydrogenase
MSGPEPVQDDLSEIMVGLRSFIDSEVIARHQDAGETLRDPRLIYEPDGRFTPKVLDTMREIRQASAKAGYFTMLVPEALGGGWETVYRRCGAEYWLGYQTLAHWARGPGRLVAAMSPDLREEIADDLLTGTKSLCFAMSEPDAGSDTWSMRSSAERVDGGWVVNGTKQWITNGPYADRTIVFAVTDRSRLDAHKGGITAFLVSADQKGFAVDSLIPMFGHSGADEGILSFRDCFVPDNHVVGEVGGGLALAMSGVSEGRLYNSARAVGLARWALAKAVDYAENRVTFGKPLIENQGIAFPLAESAMELHAARLVGIDCARALDRDQSNRTLLSMAKAVSTETAVRVIDRCVQIHGAMGFTNEVGLAEAWQQVRRICVADGSSEMMRRQIAKGVRSWEEGLV